MNAKTPYEKERDYLLENFASLNASELEQTLQAQEDAGAYKNYMAHAFLEYMQGYQGHRPDLTVQTIYDDFFDGYFVTPAELAQNYVEGLGIYVDLAFGLEFYIDWLGYGELIMSDNYIEINGFYFS